MLDSSLQLYPVDSLSGQAQAAILSALFTNSVVGLYIYYMCIILVRAERIELSTKRWQRLILPLNYARILKLNTYHTNYAP